MMREIAEGTVVDGRYRVAFRIGSGGMADVYCATDEQLGRKVALKLLYRRFAEDSEFVERFRREASSAAGLQHPNVVGVYDRGEWEGTYYIAMEHLEGRSLKQVIQEEAPLAPDRAIDLAIQVLKAARFAHKRGIIHRDLKPHNVIVDADDRAKVTDFGIARAGASDMTETGSILGTAQYLSPEQAQGHAVSATSDIYAIGVVLYEMLTGRVPFDAESAVSIALKQVSEPPVPPSTLNPAISPALEAVVLRALSKDPEARYEDAGAFIAALEEARAGTGAVPAGEATTAFAAAGVAAALPPTGPTQMAPVAEAPLPPPPGAPPGWVEEPPPPPFEPDDRRRRWPLIVLVVLLVLGALLVGFLLTRPEQVVVHDVVGLDAATAAARLQNQGLDPNIERVRSERREGIVLRQDPQPREEVDEGSEVTLIVSDGPGEATVPDVAGRSRRTAERRIEEAGFRARVREEPSDTVREGRVIETEPSANSQLERGQPVTLVVSTGPEQVEVPDVRGRSRSEAESALEDAGLETRVTRQESDEDPGTVLSQQPAPGTQVDRGSEVSIVVARSPTEVEVPDVVGEDRNAAADALQEAGFRVRFEDVEVDSPDEDGVVQDQDPPAGERARRRSAVTLSVGRFDPDLDPEGTDQPQP